MRSIVFTGIGGRPVFARGQCGSRSAPAPPTAPPSLQGTGACASSSSRGSTPVRVASSSCPWRWPPQLTQAQANTMVLQMFLSGEPSPIPPYPRARATVHLAAPRRDRPSSVEPAANPVGVPRARNSPEHPQPCDRDLGVIARPNADPRRAKHSRIASYCRGTVQDELPVDVGQRCRRSFCELVGFLRQALRDVAVTGWSQSTARVPVSAPSMELAAVAWRGAALDTSVRRRQTCDQPRHCQALPAHPEEHSRA